MGPMGFPWECPEWEYDQPWDGNGNKVCEKWELRRGSGNNHLQKALITFKFISHACYNCTAILLGRPNLSLQVDI